MNRYCGDRRSGPTQPVFRFKELHLSMDACAPALPRKTRAVRKRPGNRHAFDLAWPLRSRANVDEQRSYLCLRGVNFNLQMRLDRSVLLDRAGCRKLI